VCGRFLLTTPARVIAELFEAQAGRQGLPEMGPRYNIAPTQQVLVVRTSRERGRVLEAMRWGLIPRWAKDEAVGLRTINCRSETAATKPAWRASFQGRRCLVPADGFYEWKKLSGGKKQPMLVRVMGAGGPETFALAGLWDRWRPPEVRPIDTCTILTTEPNELLKDVHDRMPVIVPREKWGAWLDPGTGVERAKETLRPLDASAMEAYPVSALVSNTKNEGAELARRVEPKPEGQGGLFG
jgi:putative SOS response-associated peptidase YedK